MIETEIKRLLTKNEYLKLLDIANKNLVSEKEQTNYYFDTCDYSLSKNKTTLRIREYLDKHEITLKTKKMVECKNEMTVSEENNLLISFELFMQISQKNQNILLFCPEEILKKLPGEISDKELLCLGALKTKRITFRPLEVLLPAELDVSEYLGIEDFEIEWELQNEADITIAIDWLNIHSTYINSENNIIKSKYLRFIKRHKLINGIY